MSIIELPVGIIALATAPAESTHVAIVHKGRVVNIVVRGTPEWEAAHKAAFPEHELVVIPRHPQIGDVYNGTHFTPDPVVHAEATAERNTVADSLRANISRDGETA